MRMAIGLLVALCACLPARAEIVRVSAAISLKEALGEVAKNYKQESGDDVEFNFAASGQLAAQIRNGAPVDVFISAADAQMEDLGKRGMIVDESRRAIAGNRLVLVMPADAKESIKGFEELAEARVKKVAMGDPRTVPAGMYAREVLAALKINKPVEEKAVYAGSVRQALLYVERGEVDAGIVYATDAREAGDKVKVVATADAQWHSPIVYPAAIVKASDRQNAARRFLEHLRTDKPRQILSAHGFTKPMEPDGRPRASE